MLSLIQKNHNRVHNLGENMATWPDYIKVSDDLT